MSRSTALSTSASEYPRRPSLRRISWREWLRPDRRRRPASMAGIAGGLELLGGTCRAPERGRGPLRWGRSCRLLAHLRFDVSRQGRVFAQVVADVVSTLTETLVAVRHPRPALLEDRVLDRGVGQRSLARGAFVEQDVELGCPARWVHL